MKNGRRDGRRDIERTGNAPVTEAPSHFHSSPAPFLTSVGHHTQHDRRHLMHRASLTVVLYVLCLGRIALFVHTARLLREFGARIHTGQRTHAQAETQGNGRTRHHCRHEQSMSTCCGCGLWSTMEECVSDHWWFLKTTVLCSTAANQALTRN